MAVSLMGLAVILDAALAWVLDRTRSTLGFWGCFIASAVATLFGAVLVFALIVSRAFVWDSFEQR